MKRSINKIQHDEFSECMQFIAPHEYRCIGLMALLVASGKPVLPNPYTNELVRLCGIDGETEGIILLTRTGILFHCISPTICRDSWNKTVKNWLSKYKITSIVGSDPDSAWFTSLIFKKPQRSIEYVLMIMKENGPGALIPNKTLPLFLIRNASLKDAENLFPLQKGYEEEEVISPGEFVKRDVCLANLRRSLERQLIFMGEIDGKPVAKAGTNARGLAWDQLGGVYTDPSWRGKGLATLLVKYASTELKKQRRRVALFVKITNEPAQRAYIRAGFEASVPFRITYYY